MDRKTKSFISIFVITLLIVPQITFAAWWNPTTWKIWQIFNRQNVETQVIEIAETEVVEEAEVATTEQKVEAPPQERQTAPPVQAPVVQTPPVIVPTQQQNLRVCNGVTYTNTCGVGTEFFCPSSGQAYCTSPLIDSINQQQQRENDFQRQQEERRNSSECRQASNSLDRIREEIRSARAQSDSYYETYKKNNSNSAFLKYMEYSREATNLSSEQSLLLSEYYRACEGTSVLPPIPKTYNTTCYTNSYGLVSCTTY